MVKASCKDCFGIKAGANYSNFTNADFATDGLVGFHAGALVSFRICDGYSVREEFLFSSQGAKMKEDIFGKENIKVYYMSVPFLLKYRTYEIPAAFMPTGYFFIAITVATL